MARRPGTRPGVRPGLTLLEVIVSLAIFLMSLVAIGELISLAGDRALEVQGRTRALQMAQTKLAEVVAGAVPLQAQGDTPLDEDPKYSWALTADAGSVQGLWNVTVTVSRARANGTKVAVSLSQMVLDPSTTGSTQDVPGGPVPASATTAGTTSAGSSSSSSSSSGSSGGAGTSPAGSK